MLITMELIICCFIRTNWTTVKAAKWIKNRTTAYQARKIKVVKFSDSEKHLQRVSQNHKERNTTQHPLLEDTKDNSKIQDACWGQNCSCPLSSLLHTNGPKLLGHRWLVLMSTEESVCTKPMGNWEGMGKSDLVRDFCTAKSHFFS